MKGRVPRSLLVTLLLILLVHGLSAAPGELDSTFGNEGIVIKRVLGIGHYYQASSILLQPDGKLLVSGQIDEYGDMVSFFIARFNVHGSPDPSFGLRCLSQERRWVRKFDKPYCPPWPSFQPVLAIGP